MKKHLLVVIAFFFLIPFAHSQKWLEKLPSSKNKSELSLYDYKSAFDQYWEPFQVNNRGYYIENGVEKKASGWKQFHRWYYDMEGQVNPSTGAFPEKTAQQVYNEFLQANPDQRNPNAANWSNLGPSTSIGGYNGIGRLNCIAFHPTDNNTYWVGAPAGGLWVTTNNGNSWTCLTDDNDILGVSDIVIPSDYSSSQTIYIATGDRDAWDNRSIGVLKSTNGGSSWNTTGIQFNLSDYEMVTRLLLDPNNNQTIIAATTNGVFKTTNGGSSWSTQLTSTSFIDMEYKPGDFNTLYGSTTSGSIWVSSNGGGNWTETFSQGNRIELAVTPASSAYVYALVANSSSGLYGVYRSTNSGGTFSQMVNGSSINLLGWNSNGGDSGGQGWYDLSLAVSPTNANTVLVGGVNTWRSTNGGSNWSIINHWWGDGVPAVHADKHMLKYRTNGDLFECNDGGVYLSSNNGTSWAHKTNGIVISQMYKLSVSQNDANEVITGLQDNGTKLWSGGSWDDVKGGDGMECLIDYTDDNIQYGTYVYGQIDRTTNHWVNRTAIEPSGAGDGAWVTPYIIDPVNHNTLYAGYADVWKTTNKGDSWTKISTMNTGSKIRAMAIAPSNNSIILVSDPNQIWKTSNGGGNWSEITGTLPTGSSSITYIAVKADDPNTIWVSLSGYNSQNVYQSTNGGSSWSNISSGLPEIPAYTIVQNAQVTSTTHLYVGTELGVYFKDGSNNWIEYNTGLPKVKCGELEIYYDDNPANSKLRLASYGRGLWETNVEQENTDLPTVQTLTPTNITTTSASLGGNITNEGVSSVIERGVVWSDTPNPTTNDNKEVDGSTGTGSYSLPVSGLNPATSYYCRAYAINSSGTAYGGQESFTTDCNTFSLPFAESFESTTFPPNCWTSFIGDNGLGNTYNWISTNDAQDGSKAAYVKYEDVSGGLAEDWLVSPLISLSSGSSLTFYQKQTYTDDWGGDYQILVSTSSQTNQSSFSLVDSWSETDFSTTYSEKTIDLSAYDGQEVYLAFVMINDDGDDWFIDNINITGSAPTPVASVTATPGCTTGSVTVSSSLSGTQTFYLTSDNGTVLDNASVNATSYEFTDLNDGTYKGKVENNGQVSALSSAVTLNNNDVPSQPSVITGETNPCEGATETYSVTNDPEATSYSWSLPSSWSGSSNTNSITVTVGDSEGNIEVIPVNTCGNGPSRSLAISLSNAPQQPSSITGNTNVCESTQETYSVTNDAAVDSYSWSLPSGWTGTSTTNSITLTTGGSSGNITVTPSNVCGNGSSRSLSITVSPVPDQPSVINGNASVCEGNSETYSVTNDPDVSSYEWTLPSGWSGISTTNSIVVTTSNTSGDITVTPINNCGSGTSRSLAVSVSYIPDQPTSISGNAMVCEGTQETYSVTNDNNVNNYSWTIPSGWSGTSTSNTINVTVGSNDGNITVTPSNNCGTGSTRSLSVMVTNSGPPQPDDIVGDFNVCQGGTETYSVPNDVSVDNYTWTLPSGWTGNSTTNSITVSVGSNGGEISVVPTNLCGTGPAQSAVLEVNTSVPAQPDPISGPTNVCEGNSETYSVDLETDVEYTWQLPSGWTGSSSTNEINVIVGNSSGDITLIPSNACGAGPSQSLAINVSQLPNQPESLVGNEFPCEGSQETYNVIDQTNVTFNWNIPSDWTGSSTSNTITVTVGSAEGNVSVNASNDCGSSASTSVSVNPISILGNLGNISGPAQVFETQTATYNIAPATDAEIYIWSLPSIWEIQSGDESNQIEVFFPLESASGTMSITAANECNESNASEKYVEVLPLSTDEIDDGFLQIFPNPTEEIIYVQFAENLKENTQLVIYTLDGGKVLEQEFKVDEIIIPVPLEKMAGGTYLMEISNSKIHHRQKIIIHQ